LMIIGNRPALMAKVVPVHNKLSSVLHGEQQQRKINDNMIMTKEEESCTSTTRAI